MQCDLLAIARGRHEVLGTYGVAAAHAGEAAILGKTVELDGALPRAIDFIDRAWQAALADVTLVCNVVEDDRVVASAYFTHAASCSRVIMAPVGLFGKQR